MIKANRLAVQNAARSKLIFAGKRDELILLI
jgi:hypothetical protein